MECKIIYVHGGSRLIRLQMAMHVIVSAQIANAHVYTLCVCTMYMYVYIMLLERVATPFSSCLPPPPPPAFALAWYANWKGIGLHVS